MVSQADAKVWCDAVFAQLASELMKNETISIRGLGTFKTAKTTARKYFNPHTGEEVESTGSYNIRFTVSPTLRLDLNAYKEQHE